MTASGACEEAVAKASRDQRRVPVTTLASTSVECSTTGARPDDVLERITGEAPGDEGVEFYTGCRGLAEQRHLLVGEDASSGQQPDDEFVARDTEKRSRRARSCPADDRFWYLAALFRSAHS
ncbi:hypothetical protein [Mycetocola miduiensis]|uniref:hypothetical protein n=1 Tax=Mycetocola miduiensis TaxID=995034 RepID=UPI000B811EF7|nr:hypothetical protein [Mycetocola miduiensis]